MTKKMKVVWTTLVALATTLVVTALAWAPCVTVCVGGRCFLKCY